MLGNRKTRPVKHLTGIALVMLLMMSTASESILAINLPERCAGYGNLQSISLTDWEGGLELWTAGTRKLALSFDTPDWAVVGGLPDGRPGQAAFVADQNNGDCVAEDKSGALTLDSPPIVIPGGAEVPRISIDHWFATEFGWDGGNFKISVNGGDFELIPASAIETGAYSDTLFPRVDDGQLSNTNPLAEQDAFTGTEGGQLTGSWGESRINLLGIAAAGNTIKLRFEFGVDQCGGVVGWYVDTVEFYSCEAELPPSNCGNGVINGPEKCDDGNDFIDDGCSNICQIEDGWQCTAPTSPGHIDDPSFEAGRENPFWVEFKNNLAGTPICEASVCGTGGGSGASEGSFWAWFGGSSNPREGSVSQSIVIPSTQTDLTFDLEIPVCDSASDYLEVLIDGNQELLVDGSSPQCGIDGYAARSVDISSYADGGAHDLEFRSETFAFNDGVSNFFIDVITLPGNPSMCTPLPPSLTLVKNVTNNFIGTAAPFNWTLSATGTNSFSGNGPRVSSGAGFATGSYDLSESGGLDGYVASDWLCDSGIQNDVDTITVGQEDSVTCTITNDYAGIPSLTLIKDVTNDNGGNALPSAWTLTATGPTSINGAGPSVSSDTNFQPGSYDLSESGGSAGYSASAWVCVGGTQDDADTITLAWGEEVTCTISNNDDVPSLTLVKSVTNNNGGSAVPANWTLNAVGPTGFSGSGPEVSSGPSFDAGTYDLSESGSGGYTASTWVCVGGTQDDADTVTLALGEAATCTITNDDDAPGLTLIKTVTNDDGGSAVAADWTLTAAGPTSISGAGPSISSDPNFQPGSYDLSESGGPAGYSASAWVCVGGTQDDADTITLAQGEEATCTISNNDDIPSLTLVKSVTNNNGGSAVPANWTLNAAGPTEFSGSGPEVSSGLNFDAGTYDLSESGGPGGYNASAWACVGGTQDDVDTITLAPGEFATCTITNDDDGPGLTLVKTVSNDNGGSAVAADWTLTATGPTGFFGSGPSISNGMGFEAGTYDLSESGGSAGYAASSWVCVGGTQNDADTVTLGLGEAAICTITNDDIEPGLTLVKAIVNNNGGSAAPDDWTLHATGLTGFNGNGPSVSNGAGFKAGSYDLSESGGPGGYAAGAWVCNGGTQDDVDTVTLAPGEFAICTITNDDIEPGLTLDKVVINNDGGSAVAADWTLTATGPTGFSGSGPSVSNGAGFEPGTYDLSESGGPGDYTAGDWFCVGGTQIDADTVTVALGEAVTCSIANNDIGPSLTLVKAVNNNNGGSAVPADWTLGASGPTSFAGSGPSVSSGAGFDAGSYNLFESVGSAGYTGSAWVCVGGTQTDADTVTLALGESATCTITNDDDAPILTLVKVVSNNNGGSALPSAWTLTATDPDGINQELSGSGPSVTSGASFKIGTYDLSEGGGPDGYTASASWDCVGVTQDDADTITLALGDSATCTITNDDDGSGLTLVNKVTNDNGGTAGEADWMLNASGPTPFGGNGPNVPSPVGFESGTYNLSESGGPDGYSVSAWVCVGGTQNDADTVTLALGEAATCTITNDDNAPGLTLVKAVTNDNGGSELSSAWTLTATGTDSQDPNFFDGSGPIVSSGAGFDAGSYDLTESGPAGYSGRAWECTGVTPDDADTITLALGQVATCTIINDDNASGLTLFNNVPNDNGGSADPADWTLHAFGPTRFSGNDGGSGVLNGAGFEAGSYDLSQSGGPSGYTASAWVCDGDEQLGNTVTVALGESVTCTITNDDDESGLTLVKEVVSNNGGLASPADWILFATGSTPLEGNGPTVSKIGADFDAGTYVLSEEIDPVSSVDLADYIASPWVCNGGFQNIQNDAQTITVAPGEFVTCTIVNDDVGPGTGLTLIKNVNNHNGGMALPSDWTLAATGPTGFNGIGPIVSSGVGFADGKYNLSETGSPEGYTDTNWNCVGGSQLGDTITLGLDDTAICTITNSDVAVTSLTLYKEVINDNGGLAERSDWVLTAAGLSGFAGNDTGSGVSSGMGFLDGAYVLSESIDPISLVDPNDYNTGTWVCDGGDLVDNTVTLLEGESVSCMITNNDIPPSLTLEKAVINNNGGSAAPSAWTLTATGMEQPAVFSGSGPIVSSGASFDAGSYLLTESIGPPGYSAQAWICDGDGTLDGNKITLALGDVATCTITNDDDGSGLTLVNNVTNDNGGTAGEADWMLNASGPTPFGGNGPNVLSPAGFQPGTYNLSQSGGPTGYTAGAWVCVGEGTQNDADTITLALGESATCTLSIDDIEPGLTLLKAVTNNNGGNSSPSAWILTAIGPTGFFGTGPSVPNGANFKAGSYDLSESDGPTGYAASDWVCNGGTQDDADTITLAPGEFATCTITNDDTEPGLTLVKEVIIDNGGLATPADWTLTATGPTGFSGSGIGVSNGAGFEPGTYNLSESGGPGGYTAGAWVCVGGTQDDADTVTLALGESAICTIINNDDVPGLTLVKAVTNNNGGNAAPSAWTLTATGPTPFSGSGPSVSHPTPASFKAGTYDLSESGGPGGYTAGAWVCDGGTRNDADTLTLALGESATCTIINDDNVSGLTLIKLVTNNNGGNAAPSAWTLKARGPTDFSGSGPSVSSGASFVAGTYQLSEEGGPAGYTGSAWNCVGGTQDAADTITLVLGESATCTISNNDDVPSLTLVKKVTKNNGGTAVPADWTLHATGPTPFSGSGPNVSSGASFDAGSYDLSESGGPDGYSGGAWVCDGGTQNDADTVTLALGESATCTITNNDDVPALTLVKVVTNNNGGLAAPADWTLAAAGPTPFSGSGPNVSSGASFVAGTYQLSEEGGPTDYTGSAWNCIGGTQDAADTITLALGESATCTISNNDDVPSLTLVKEVTNNNGGSAAPADWTLAATGPTGFNGIGPSVSSGASFDAGSYDLSESGGPDGYSGGAWVCDGGTQNDADTVTLALGESATCTITNNDDVPALTLVKVVTNNNGGTAVPADWTLAAAGPTPISGSGPNVSSGASFDAGTYDLSESGGPAGYTASTWVCDGGTQNDADTVTLALGESATCTITNNDDVPALTLVKVVTNNNGGLAVPADWTLGASGPTSIAGSGPSVSSGASFDAGSYDLSESVGSAGYTGSAWVCVGGTQIDTDTVTLALGESATCTITNNDDAPTLTLVKVVTNNNGGTAVPADWTLAATGPTGFNGIGPSVSSGTSFDAGTYDLSESGGPAGYTASTWVCDGGTQNDADTVTLALGDTATCTIFNDDDGPGLTLIKQVTNDNGGSAVSADWMLTASGPTGFSGAGPSVSNAAGFEHGTYDLSESGGPAGYTASDWVCVGGTQDDADTITLSLGDAATCTIINDDDGSGLTLVKKVTNNSGGSAAPADWILAAAGPTPFSGSGPSVSHPAPASFKAGTYDMSESGGPEGYSASAWVCVGGTQDDTDTVTLVPGESATCTITNDDSDSTSLTLVKKVSNTGSGTALPSAWTLTATGPSSFNGSGPDVSNGPDFFAGTYDLSESGGPAGYTASDWVCVGGTQVDGDTVTLALGEIVTCTITNSDADVLEIIFKDSFE